MRLRREWLVPLGGLALVLLHHAAWYSAFPQYSVYPPDQSGYLAGGHAIFTATAGLLRDGITRPAVEELRRWFDFLGIALVYGTIDAVRPNDLGFARAVLASFNALTALGVFALARRLHSPRAGLLALVFVVVSPAFPSGASRLYADAITGCLLVWGARLFVEGGRLAVLAGFLAGAAMLIRVQMLPWVPLGLAICSVAALVMRVGPGPRAVMARGWIGLSLPLLLFAGLSWFGLENRNDSAPKHNLPRYHYYAYGFWQYLESDGWEGPWRLKKDPFYAALVEESRGDPGLLQSRPRQYVFAARYVASRLDAAIPIVLGNFYRIFDRPQNPEHRGFIDAGASVWIHRLAMLCAVVGAIHLYASGSVGFVAPLLVLSVGAFHALAWGWPRYAMPVLPILLALGGIGLDLAIGAVRDRWRAWALWGLLLGGGFGLSMLLADRAPEMAWALRTAALIAGLVAFVRLPFVAGARPAARVPGLIFAAGLAVVVLGNAWRDRGFHEREIPLRAGDVVRQEIHLTPVGLSQLRAAHDRYVTVDLELNDSRQRPWPATVNGFPVELQPSIPFLPESIPIQEEARAYPQWWLASLTDAMLDRIAVDGRMIVELSIDQPGAARLRGDRFRDQDTVFEAPSLGDWPYAAGIKPEYDRDFRLVRRMPLSSAGTTTALIRAGSPIPLAVVARIRAMALEDRDGRLSFDLKRAVPGGNPGAHAKESIFAFAGRAILRNRGAAEFIVSGQRLIGFQIAPFADAAWAEGDVRLCYEDRTPDRSQFYESRGLYIVAGPLPCAGESCRVEVRFWPGMDDRPMSFSAEPARSQPPLDVLQQAARECDLRPEAGLRAPRAGFALARRQADPIEGSVEWVFDRVVDGTMNSYPEDRGRWRVERVY